MHLMPHNLLYSSDANTLSIVDILRLTKAACEYRVAAIWCLMVDRSTAGRTKAAIVRHLIAVTAANPTAVLMLNGLSIDDVQSSAVCWLRPILLGGWETGLVSAWGLV